MCFTYYMLTPNVVSLLKFLYSLANFLHLLLLIYLKIIGPLFKKKNGKSAMELELGLKITQTRGDLTSTADFRIAKDRAGPVFLSRENDTMFILTAHLKGQFLSLNFTNTFFLKYIYMGFRCYSRMFV